MTVRRVLVIEDSDAKFMNIELAIQAAAVTDIKISRSNTAIAAERDILNGPWFLVVLDMSLNITESKLGGSSGGHATLGGMAIAEKMYLLGAESPTVIVTAFDAFQAQAPANPNNSVVGIEYIEAYAGRVLGDFFWGCVRYSNPGWVSALQDIVRKRAAKDEGANNS